MATVPQANADRIDRASASEDAAAADESAHSRLGMQLGDEYWLLDLTDVAEVIPIPELLRVPLTKPWYAGVANIRGNLVSVIDLAAFFGRPAVTHDDKARLILVGEKHRINSGLIFSRVIGLRQFERFEREADAAQLPAWVEARYRDHEQQRWNALNMHGLVTHPDFLAVELHTL
jgi:twitching motility protein PilI